MYEKVKYIHCPHCHQYSNIEGVAHTEYIKCSKCGEQIQLYVVSIEGNVPLFKKSKQILIPMSSIDTEVIKNFYKEISIEMQPDDIRKQYWFDYDAGASLLFRTILPVEYREIETIAYPKFWQLWLYIKMLIGKYDYPYIVSFLVMDKIIIDWNGILDSSNNQIPCTSENKFTLFNNDMKFLRFVNDKIKLIHTY